MELDRFRSCLSQGACTTDLRGMVYEYVYVRCLVAVWFVRVLRIAVDDRLRKRVANQSGFFRTLSAASCAVIRTLLLHDTCAYTQRTLGNTDEKKRKKKSRNLFGPLPELSSPNRMLVCLDSRCGAKMRMKGSNLRQRYCPTFPAISTRVTHSQ